MIHTEMFCQNNDGRNGRVCSDWKTTQSVWVYMVYKLTWWWQFNDWLRDSVYSLHMVYILQFFKSGNQFHLTTLLTTLLTIKKYFSPSRSVPARQPDSIKLFVVTVLWVKKPVSPQPLGELCSVVAWRPAGAASWLIAPWWGGLLCHNAKAN